MYRWHMLLSEWLDDQGMTDTEFGTKLRVRPYTVGRWKRGERTPDVITIVEIEDFTKGDVTVRDWAAQAQAALDAEAQAAREKSKPDICAAMGA